MIRKPWVKSSFAPGSKVAKLYLEEAGLLPELEKLGFGIVGYACTTCNGMSGVLDPKIQQEIIDRDLYTTAVLSGNRNFDGRIHPYAKQAFLASPPLVVAYALAGSIRFDIERDALGTDNQGNPVYLNDLWPSDEEIDAVVGKCVKPEQFNQVYIQMFKLNDEARNSNPLYDWRPMSTYIRRPPYWKVLWRENERCRACVHWRFWVTTLRPTICRRLMRFWLPAQQGSIWPKWRCRKRTLILTQRTEVII